MLISARHSPPQQPLHWAMQSASPGSRSQLPSHSRVHVAWHEASHSAESLLALQRLEQSAAQLPSHEALQSKDPGSTLQSASHEPWQLAVHSTSASTLQLPWQPIEPSTAHAALKATGLQAASQPPSTRTSQLAPASTKMSPQASRPPA